MSFYVKLRYVLKVVSAAAWVVILPVTYAYTWKKNPPGFAQTIKSWFGNNSSSPSLFIMAVVLYLAPNILAALLFVFPFIRRYLERSNYKIVMFTMWWSQVYTISVFADTCQMTKKHLRKLMLFLLKCHAASALCWKRNA